MISIPNVGDGGERIVNGHWRIDERALVGRLDRRYQEQCDREQQQPLGFRLSACSLTVLHRALLLSRRSEVFGVADGEAIVLRALFEVLGNCTAEGHGRNNENGQNGDRLSHLLGSVLAGEVSAN